MYFTEHYPFHQILTPWTKTAASHQLRLRSQARPLVPYHLNMQKRHHHQRHHHQQQLQRRGQRWASRRIWTSAATTSGAPCSSRRSTSSATPPSASCWPTHSASASSARYNVVDAGQRVVFRTGFGRDCCGRGRYLSVLWLRYCLRCF